MYMSLVDRASSFATFHCLVSLCNVRSIERLRRVLGHGVAWTETSKTNPDDNVPSLSFLDLLITQEHSRVLEMEGLASELYVARVRTSWTGKT